MYVHLSHFPIAQALKARPTHCRTGDRSSAATCSRAGEAAAGVGARAARVAGGKGRVVVVRSLLLLLL